MRPRAAYTEMDIKDRGGATTFTIASFEGALQPDGS
jgi:hypothetical protein